MRLIDADATLQIIDGYAKTVEGEHKEVIQAIRDIVEVISPTVDAIEVVHGEWQFGNRNGQYGYYCSKCHTGFTGENAHWIAREHLYCPRCGAKMDGKVSE